MLKIEDRWSRSLETMIRRYGEIEGKERYEKHTTNLKLNMPNCKEYYKHRNIPDDVAFELMSYIQAERNLKIKRSSKESLKVLLPIILDIEFKNDLNVYYGDSEKFIPLTKREHDISNNRIYFYDFCIEKYNIIIEYHGVRFHEDLDYDSTEKLSFEHFDRNFNKDLFKKWLAEDRGYKVFILRSWVLKEDKFKLYEFLTKNGVDVCKSLFF